MKKIVGTLSAIVLTLPLFAYAYPFGGQASIVLRCVYNSTIFARLGPPIGGDYVWTTATKTYQFGPPTHAGQWLLGLAGAPYYCIYSVKPEIVYNATAIIMMGSSGAAAPGIPSMGGGTTLSVGSPTSGSSASGGSGSGSGTGTSAGTSLPASGPAGHVLINEVYYNVDSTHGTKPLNEWIELYNPTYNQIDISGWIVEDASAVGDTISSGTTIPARGFIVISGNSSTRTFWSIPQSASLVPLGSPVGDGLSNVGDAVILKNASGTVVDAASWGSSRNIFNPSVPVVLYGHSMARGVLGQDTNTASDWVEHSVATPGQ